MRNRLLILIVTALLLAGCATPPKGKLARVAYQAIPNTVAIGVLSPYDTLPSLKHGFVSLTATYMLRPFLPPVRP